MRAAGHGLFRGFGHQLGGFLGTGHGGPDLRIVSIQSRRLPKSSELLGRMHLDGSEQLVGSGAVGLHLYKDEWDDFADVGRGGGRRGERSGCGGV